MRRGAVMALRSLRGTRAVAGGVSPFPSAAPRRREASRPAPKAGRAAKAPAIGHRGVPPSPSRNEASPLRASFAASASPSSDPPPAPLPTVEVDVRVDGKPLRGFSERELERLAAELEADAAAAAAAALRRAASSPPPRLRRRRRKEQEQEKRERPASLSLVSLVLCDDETISELNGEWRGVDGPTDVLSFPQLSFENDRSDDEGPPSSLSWLASEFSSDGGGEGADDEDDVDDEEYDEDSPSSLPPRVLGDLVLSLDTASRQASERSHSLREECRVLLVHGSLHLLGYDHEGGSDGDEGAAKLVEEDAEAMAAAERAIMKELGWDGDGLIDAATKASERGGGGSKDDDGDARDKPLPRPPRRRPSAPVARAVAIDLDGTLLDSSSRACREGAEAAARALEAGVSVVVSTGKARPAARAALDQVGLGELLVGPRSPGVFLQGLAAYGRGGRRVGGGGEGEFPCLPASVVRAAFDFASSTPGVSAVAFTGDECFTLRVTRETDELHSVYHEPLPRVPDGGLEELLSSPAETVFGGTSAGNGAATAGERETGRPGEPSLSRVLKMLFVADPSDVDSVLKPYWEDLLLGGPPGSNSSRHGIPRGVASPMQAVPNMLELVPKGVDKALGLTHVFRDLGIDPRDAVAVGDGSNDLPMMKLVGTPVAMGNAVLEVKSAARHVVASNDEGGVAEAIERFVLGRG